MNFNYSELFDKLLPKKNQMNLNQSHLPDMEFSFF